MLEWMQRHKKWLVVTVWVSAFALIFGLYLPDLFGDKMHSSDVAKVGDDYITRVEYDEAYNEMYRRLREFYPNFDDMVSASDGRVPEVENLAFDRLVEERLLLSLADKMNVSTTDAEMVNFLIDGPYSQYFQNDFKQFDKEKYKSAIASSGLTTEQFESNISKDLLIDKMRKFPVFTLTTLELDSFATAFKIYDDIALMVLNKDSILSGVNIALSEDEIKTYWESNKTKYNKPAIYKLAYISINSNDIDYDDADIEKFYKENAQQYSSNALQTQRDDIINDYKKEYAKAAAAYLNSAKDKISKDSTNRNYEKILSNISKDDIKKLKNNLDNSATLDSIPINFLEIDDNDFFIYQNLLAQLPNADIGFMTPVYENNLQSWIVPYVIEKTPSVQLAYDEAKDRVSAELKAQKEQEQFKKSAYAILKDSKDSDFKNIGLISLDIASLTSFQDSESYKNLVSLGLDNADIKSLIDGVFTSSDKKDIVFVNNKALLFNIKKQKLPTYDETTNITNAQNDQIEQLKEMDMTEALFEYAKDKYKIIDYRRQN